MTALAIKFPSQNRDAIVAATTSVILFTTYVQGGTTNCFLRCANIPIGQQAEEEEPPSTNRQSGSTSIRRRRSNRDQTLPRWMRSIKTFHLTTLRPLLIVETTEHERMVDPVDVAIENANI